MNEFMKYLRFLIQKRRLLLVHFFIAIALSFLIVLKFTPVQYQSSITFFPPFEDNSFMSVIPGIGGLGVSASTDIVPQQINTIFNSIILKTKLINKYNLLDEYKIFNGPNKIGRGLKALQKNMSLDVEELGSLGMSKPIAYTISFYHTNPDTAYLCVKYIYKMIDSTIKDIGMAHGRSNKEFIEKKLFETKTAYDSIKSEFDSFQTSNKAYDLPEQVNYTIKQYAELSNKLTMQELKLKKFQSMYSKDNPNILTTKQEIAILKRKLQNIESKTTPSVMVGLNNSTTLVKEYIDFTRNIEFYNKLILMYQQQYEEALLKESNNLSNLEIIDPAVKPIYKARPKRVIRLIITFIEYGIVFFSLLTMYYLIKYILPNQKWLNELFGDEKE